MLTTTDMVTTTIKGYNPAKCASEYRLAAATVYAVFGKKGDRDLRSFTAVIDLDYWPMPLRNDNGLMSVRLCTGKNHKFRVMPILGIDFTQWRSGTSDYGTPEYGSNPNSVYLDNYIDRLTAGGVAESTDDDKLSNKDFEEQFVYPRAVPRVSEFSSLNLKLIFG